MRVWISVRMFQYASRCVGVLPFFSLFVITLPVYVRESARACPAGSYCRDSSTSPF